MVKYVWCYFVIFDTCILEIWHGSWEQSWVIPHNPLCFLPDQIELLVVKINVTITQKKYYVMISSIYSKRILPSGRFCRKLAVTTLCKQLWDTFMPAHVLVSKYKNERHWWFFNENKDNTFLKTLACTQEMIGISLELYIKATFGFFF